MLTNWKKARIIGLPPLFGFLAGVMGYAPFITQAAFGLPKTRGPPQVIGLVFNAYDLGGLTL